MSSIHRRCVFYLSGFDPKGASHYHKLYKTQSAKQSQVNGWSVFVSPRKRLPSGDAAWTVHATPPDTHGDAAEVVETHYEFLHWDDIVRKHWPQSTWTVWRDIVRTSFYNIRHGSLWRMYKLSWPPAFALFIPLLLVCMLVLGTPLLAVLVGYAVAHGSHSLMAGSVAGTVTAGAFFQWGKALEARYSMYWMMRSYAFTWRQATGQTPELDARLQAHAARLVQRWSEGLDDEIVVVGHSTGSLMAVIVLAKALRLAPALAATPTDAPASRSPKIALLTLGQWLPLLGLLPQAVEFRADLSQVARASAISWLDFSAPPDGCCFALTDPIAGSGIQAKGLDPERPKLLSPKFADMFDAARYKLLRKDKFEMHFQYLMASDRAVDFDYFLITAANMSLAQRFNHLAHVKDFAGLRPF